MATKYPPQISFSDAVRIIKEIVKTHGDREVSQDLLPDIYKVSRKSSYFSSISVFLQKLGLVERKANGILRLTDLAMTIIKPVNNDDVEAKLTSARNDEILAGLMDKYPNFTLPSADQTKETLVKQFGIDRNQVDKWYQFVVDSFRELSTKQTVSRSSSTDSEIPPKPPVGKPTPKGLQSFELPSGKTFSFTLEEGTTKDDLDFITDFFELKKKRL